MPLTPWQVPVKHPVGGESFIAVEAYSGRVIHQHGAEVVRPWGDMANVAVAVVCLDWANATRMNPGVVMQVPPGVLPKGRANPLHLKPGERITFRDAIYSCLMGTDGASAQTLAHFVGSHLQQTRGGRPMTVFVGEMNRLARALRMGNTTFYLTGNVPQGSGSARDMARLATHGMRNPALAFYTKQARRNVSVAGANGMRTKSLENKNKLLKTHSINGLKASQGALAGRCYLVNSEPPPHVSSLPDGRSQVRPKRLIVVVLNSTNAKERAARLVTSAWRVYESGLRRGMALNLLDGSHLNVPKL